MNNIEVKTFEGTVIELDKLGSGSLLVIRCDRPPRPEEMKAISGAIPRGHDVGLLFVSATWKIESVPEKTLNELGWFRTEAGR